MLFQKRWKYFINFLGKVFFVIWRSKRQIFGLTKFLRLEVFEIFLGFLGKSMQCENCGKLGKQTLKKTAVDCVRYR